MMEATEKIFRFIKDVKDASNDRLVISTCIQAAGLLWSLRQHSLTT